MTKLWIALVAMLTISTGSAQAQNDVRIRKQNISVKDGRMTPEALWAMGRISSYAASPDGQKIVYQVGYYSVKHNKSHHVLYMMNADGTGQQLLTTSDKNETDATWLNAETIAFLRGGEIWTMKHDGSDRRQLSQTDGSVEGFKFSPDRKKVIILKSIPFHGSIMENPADLPKATGRLVTDLMYRHWDHYVESIQHPFVAEVQTNENSQLTILDSQLTDILEGEPYECPMEPFGGIEQLDWSTDSKTIAYTCRKKTGVAYSISTDSDIYIYNIGTRETKNLCKPADYKVPEVDPTKTLKTQSVNSEENLKNLPGYDQNPKFSPDGKYVAWLSMSRDGYESDRQRLCCCDLTTGEKKFLTESFDSHVDDFCWSDNKDAMIYFIGVWHATENLYAINWKGELKQLTNTWHDFGSLQMMNDGKRILAERHCYTAPADLYAITPNFKKPEKTVVAQITEENKHILDQLDKPTVDQRWVKTTDGQKMLYWIILPPNFDETKKYPTLLFCEGGPQSPVSQFWSYRWNFMIMASQGYVIIAPNRHGLPGFGQEWLEEISGDWTGQCMSDYLTAIDDAAANLPYVDKDHLGAVGASFGGFSVYYLAGHHDKRFKCFIAHDGAFNLEAMYTETEENWFSNWEYDDAYWNRDQTANARKTYQNSPHRFIDKWDTPILCIHGEKDYRINATQGMSAFNAARMRGIEAQLLIFPDENHWVLKPQNGILWQRTYFGWLDRWLKEEVSK
ncbi:MAG: S9 family peptidase [Prevotella sp.]|nr:S9 family peptidase [Prevotella sp.]